MIHNSFTSDGTVNEGISITQWVINVNHQDVKLNVWDFGWQEIVHATHQFFLTTNCLYLLVLDASQDETDNRAEYWLKIIHSFGGDSPVIIVTNKVDQNSLELNLKSFRQKYPNIADVVQTSCKDQKGITQLTLAIQSQIMSLPHVFNALPKSWFSVKEHLENIRANYITYSQYQAVCFEHAILDEQQQILIGLLHDLGIVLNFLDDPRLRNTNILNPRWVTHGIYKILNAHDLADNKGELDIGCLTQLLDTQNYPRERHGFLMELMRKFELCFPFQDSQDRYLIPDLLDKQQPPNAEDFILEDCLNFRYEYSILPEGLLPRFIVRTHVLSSNPLRWRTGVILDFEGNRALVKADRQDRSVTISINGPQQGRRRLLAIIRSDFERIHSSFKTQPEEKVPTPKHPQLSLNYDDLLVMEKQGLTEVPMVIDAQVIQININDLLNGVDLDKPKLTARESEHSSGALKLFYSYSYKDEALRDQLEIRLRLLQRNGLIQSWHDRQIPPGKDWDEELDRNLEQADIILLLVSPNFIASDYCYEVEMTRARERHDAKEAILIPILIRPVDWHTVPFNDIQALPSDLKPVTKWLDKDDAWLNIEQGIKQVIQSIKKDKSL